MADYYKIEHDRKKAENIEKITMTSKAKLLGYTNLAVIFGISCKQNAFYVRVCKYYMIVRIFSKSYCAVAG